MSGKRYTYTEEFKLEAIKQITERGYKLSDGAKRLDVTSTNLNEWLKKYGNPKMLNKYPQKKGWPLPALTH